MLIGAHSPMLLLFNTCDKTQTGRISTNKANAKIGREKRAAGNLFPAASGTQ